MSQPLIVKIPIRNRHGEIVGERDAVSYAGLLSLAHGHGLDRIETTIVQVPTDANGQVAIVHAVIVGRRGSYTGIGDANPANVSRALVRHLLRIAETRAKARALRDMVSVGEVSLDELGSDDDLVEEESIGASSSEPLGQVSPERSSGAMSDAQRRVLYRQCAQLGHEGPDANAFLAARLGIRDDRPPTKREASRLIDELDLEIRRLGQLKVPSSGRTHAA